LGDAGAKEGVASLQMIEGLPDSLWGEASDETGNDDNIEGRGSVGQNQGAFDGSYRAPLCSFGFHI
jgi:hypothetical protein